MVIDFERWLELRRRAEEGLFLAPRLPGDPPVTVWSADSTYAVVLADRGRAPNLAAVREISMGVWNETALPISGEIWVDELRLGKAVRDAGIASSFNVNLDGGGVITTSLNMTNRGAFFRQLRDDPSYQTDETLSLYSSLAVDRWLPAGWPIRSQSSPVWRGESGAASTMLASRCLGPTRLGTWPPISIEWPRISGLQLNM